MNVYTLSPAAIDRVRDMLTEAVNEGLTVKVAFDDGLKVKVGEGMWTPPLGRSTSPTGTPTLPANARLAPTLTQPVTAGLIAVLDAINAAYPGLDDLFVADHNHGDVQTPGAWSIAHEGHYEWPFTVTAAQRENRTVPTDLLLEVGAGWRLDVYPGEDARRLGPVF